MCWMEAEGTHTPLFDNVLWLHTKEEVSLSCLIHVFVSQSDILNKS